MQSYTHTVSSVHSAQDFGEEVILPRSNIFYVQPIKRRQGERTVTKVGQTAGNKKAFGGGREWFSGCASKKNQGHSSIFNGRKPAKRAGETKIDKPIAKEEQQAMTRLPARAAWIFD